MTQQLSEHRHISFTAHYTGYIWYSMGISHPVFATAKGKMLAKLVHPLESWAEKFIGGSMRSTLKQRHSMIDQHLTQLIEQHPDLQVLEIASGLSPRGWNFRQKFPNIDYRELDLPDMAKVKTQALQKIDRNSPEVLAVDLFTADFEQAFQVFDPTRPLVVISEGLINYFNKDMLLQLLRAIAHYGQNFKELHYLTDIYPEPVKNKLANFIWGCSKLLKWMSRSAFSFHFIHPQQAQDFFQQAGFEQVNIVQPQHYFNHQPPPLSSSEEHLGDLVWMIHASIKNSVD
ncbi:leucine carboxyl methyltransferase [Acinetobacter sp. ANC 4470]|uniref:class I SAM-dependent methyltransferase n=1 Tax=Acinetobacter sp. ANC 4470 TaxID=1977881 RepID=UPI000A33B036|nr:class I SAM-dependent methyltransferase [Acinetobacter sp. ANC 4470]OTG68544.1 leucine carboxyl methyltransferase [Acinetobacter sp. ANC 4470]